MTRLFGLFLISLSLFGCQSTPKTLACAETDWFEVGRQDGSAGRVRSSQAQKKQCGQQFDINAENLYTNGYNNGLAEYCSVDNGYAIGLAGNRPSMTCPAPIDQVFMAAVARGKQARKRVNQVDSHVD